MLDVANLSFHYQPQLPILNNLSFSVPDGKIVGLLGKNGVGKTTTLKLLLGLLPIERGHITLDAISLTAQPLRYKERLNYVSAKQFVCPVMDVRSFDSGLFINRIESCDFMFLQLQSSIEITHICLHPQGRRFQHLLSIVGDGVRHFAVG